MKYLNKNKVSFHTGCGNFRAKKSMSQNFLKSVPALNMMCSSGDINSKDIILEIGPGKGALTSKLLEEAGIVFAVEKDNELFNFLKEKFENEIKNKKLILIEDDILNLDLKKYNFKNKKYKIVANIPYNITGGIIRKFLSSDIQPERMILLVQKEVAERIVARDNKESILSLSVKAYGNPKYIMKVHKRFFSPSPKVDSAILAITDISKNNFKDKFEEEKFFDIVKNGFAHKRKLLYKNLENFHTGCGNLGEGEVEKLFLKLGIDKKARAEEIKIDKWLLLSKDLSTDS